MQGFVASAISTMEPGLFHMLASGVHPLHHTCMDIYTCLGSAWRLHARGNKQNPTLAAVAYARAALYTLMLAHGLKQLLDTGNACSSGCQLLNLPCLYNARSCACVVVRLSAHASQCTLMSHV